MPSRKVQAAVDGRATYTTRKSTVKTRVRESVVPEDPDLAKVQEDLRQSVDKMLKGTPLADGRFVSGAFSSTPPEPAEIEHGLGGAAKGFIVCNLEAAETVTLPPSIWRLKGSAGREDTHIRLMASEPCIVLLWIFR